MCWFCLLAFFFLQPVVQEKLLRKTELAEAGADYTLLKRYRDEDDIKNSTVVFNGFRRNEADGSEILLFYYSWQTRAWCVA